MSAPRPQLVVRRASVPPRAPWDTDGPNRQRQRCKACGMADKFDFHVPDEIWEAVAPPGINVLCLFCFDEYAKRKGIAYAKHLSEACFAGDGAVFQFEVKSAVGL